jgi:hypothetical protein
VASPQGMPVVDVPSHEASWLLCTSWNRGLRYMQGHQPTWAARWMKLALKLVDMPCLHVERTRYKETMLRAYQEVCFPLTHCPRLSSSPVRAIAAATRPNGIHSRSPRPGL